MPTIKITRTNANVDYDADVWARKLDDEYGITQFETSGAEVRFLDAPADVNPDKVLALLGISSSDFSIELA